MSKSLIVGLIIMVVFFSILGYGGNHKISEFTRKAYLVEDVGGRDDSKFQNPVIFHRFVDKDSNYYNIYTQELQGFKTLKIGDSVILTYHIYHMKFAPSKYDTFFINYKMIN